MPTLPIGEPVPTLAFDFPPGWEVEEFDRDRKPGVAPGFYRHTILTDGVEHIRGVDIICRPPDAGPRVVLIEVKDDRERTMAPHLRHEELRRTILNKVLGTLAGLTLAERLGEPTLRPMACLSRQPALEVVLFLEEPPAVPVSHVGSKRALRRLVNTQFRSDLDQRLTAKLATWGLSFRLHNLTNRRPTEWTVRPIP